MLGFKQNHLNEGQSPYFIAEIGINHNGVFDLAKKMIDCSKEAGAKAVKFQKRDVPSLVLEGAVIPEPTGILSQDENDIPSDEKKAFGTWTYPDSRLEFSDEKHLELWKYTESIGMDYVVSPWEEKSVDFLANNKAKVIKLASIDANNYQFCEYIAGKGIPTIVSTGMTTYAEMQITSEIFSKANCPQMFLHCTSAYPSPIEDKHLKCIKVLQEMFGEDVGFSGHAISVEGTLGAIALGANVVEKHVTLNREMSGPDHSASLEFDEFAETIRMGNNMVLALGTARKTFLPSEKVLHGILSKRIITKKELRKGTVLEPTMLRTVVTKQEGGLLPNEYYNVLGTRLKNDFPANHILKLGDCERA
jgi:N,N'-diacetyllegionaminate synthase